MWKCARLLGRDPVAAIVLVGLNPIVLVWGLGGDHNDFLMVFSIVLGFYLLLRRRRRARGDGRPCADGARAARRPTVRIAMARSWSGYAAGCAAVGAELGAGAAFVAATAIKASGAVLIPVVLAGLLSHAAAR